MDDLAHDLANHFPFNHRKRKQQQDDVDNESVPPWLPSHNDSDIWSSPSSPQVSSPLSSFPYPPRPSKRPRLERIETSLRHPRRHLSSSRKASPFTCRSSPLRPGSDVEDIGLVSTADPGPSTGSLLDLRTAPKLAEPGPSSPTVPPFIPIDTTSPHIPSLQPLINRHTLKELDLDTILRNPQLRAFHPG
jgi:hypothetical protein